MQTSPKGRALIERREGRRLSAYRDTRGIWTVGVGHTGRMSPPAVTAGMTITETQCEAMLARDLAPVEATIARCVGVPMTQNEFDAMASLGFNIGAAGLARSSVVRKLDAGDAEGAAAAFMAWSKPASLAGRRREEAAQFRGDDAGGASAREVAAARADVLAARAATTHADARRTRRAGAATAASGAMLAAATGVTHHHHLGLLLFGIVCLGAIVDGAVAWSRHATALALAANASRQTAVVAIPAHPAITVPAPTHV